MNITYLDIVPTGDLQGQKVAKIAREKCLNLRSRFEANRPKEEPKPVFEEPKEAPKVVSETPKVEVAEEEAPEVKTNGLASVITAYKGGLGNTRIEGTRKLKVNTVVKNGVVSYANKYGEVRNDPVESVTKSMEDTINEINSREMTRSTRIYEEPVAPKTEPKVETPKPVEAKKENKLENYLNYGSTDDVDKIIIQKSKDNEGLRSQIAEIRRQKEQMIKELDSLRQQKTARIEELDNENLSLTQSLEELKRELKTLSQERDEELRTLGR